MKKIISLVLLCVLCLTLVGCGEKAKEYNYPNPSSDNDTNENSNSTNDSNSNNNQENNSNDDVYVGDFDIVGVWKQDYGISGWESSNGRLVQFNAEHQCNIFSPSDTYGISNKENGGFNLYVTGLLGGNLTYHVKIITYNKIEVYSSDKITLQFKFTRLE